MKTAEKKEQFILLRAEGLSFQRIITRLRISKATCSKWEREFSERIRGAKEERLEDLYTLYRIGREAHIKKLGETLKRIDSEIAKRDFSEIPAEKLLKLKLDYEDRLQAQRTEPAEENAAFAEYTQEELLKATAILYERIKAGSVTMQQARAELATLESMQKAITAKENAW